MSNETFKDIPGYEGLYQVSENGNVLSVEKYVKHSRGGNQIVKPRVLKQFKQKSGYVSVVLSKEGKLKTYTIHRLVMLAFVGVSELVVDHIDGNKTNNSLPNLRYCTQRDNIGFSKKMPGVSINPPVYKKRYRSRINIGGKLKDLGSYLTADEAAQAYQNYKRQIQ